MENTQDRDDDSLPQGTTGLYCFINCERPCGPDCMSFLPVVPDGADYKTPDGCPHQWSHCMLLVNAHKLGKHIVHLVAKTDESVKLAKSIVADQSRVTCVPMPQGILPQGRSW